MQQQEDLIREIVRRVMAQAGDPVKQRDIGGAMLIHTASVETDPFEGRSDVRLRDLTTLEEAPRIGAGLMELLDGADFEWTLTYDEYDYVMEGTLEIVLDSGTVLVGQPGDVLYIPKDTHIHFRTPQKARYVYFVYPADWQ
ncbi:cupin domain-containing protein [Oscillospiraceae bacterium 38-13]